MTWASFVKSAYKACREWGMQPSEFWQLSPTEFWWEFDFKIKAQRELSKKMPGKPSGSGATAADWEAARKRFREKHG